ACLPFVGVRATGGARSIHRYTVILYTGVIQSTGVVCKRQVGGQHEFLSRPSVKGRGSRVAHLTGQLLHLAPFFLSLPALTRQNGTRCSINNNPIPVCICSLYPDPCCQLLLLVTL